MKKLVVLATLALASCSLPDNSDVKVIVGAKLVNPGREPIDFSVVVVEKGKIIAAGKQSQVPVPKGSSITRGLNMTLMPETPADFIEAGKPANLVLKGDTIRRMHAGEWVP